MSAMKQLTLPVSDGAGELLELDLTRAAEVVNEEVAKHLARDAVLGHEGLGRALERDGQVRDRVTGDARRADRAVRQRRLVLDAAQAKRVNRSDSVVRIHLYVSLDMFDEAVIVSLLTSAPGMRTSKRVAEGLTPGAEMMRIDAARESYPYDAVSGAQYCCPSVQHFKG